MAGNGYEKEIKYITDWLHKNATIARNNSHVQTILRAAKQGESSARAFVISTQLESKLH